MCVLGARTQMCVHKDISLLSGAAQDFACRTTVASRSCSHHRAVEAYARSSNASDPLDIEDMLADGRAGSCGPCPYFLSRERSKVRDLFVVPKGCPWTSCCTVDPANVKECLNPASDGRDHLPSVQLPDRPKAAKVSRRGGLVRAHALACGLHGR